MPDQPRVEVRPLTDAQPDMKNANKHSAKAQKYLENSLRKRGFFRPIAAAGKNGDVRVIAGNLTQESAVEVGMEDAIFVYTDGTRPIVHVRTDLDPDSPEAALLGIEDNRVAQVSLDWDTEALTAMIAGEDALLERAVRGDDVAAELITGIAIEKGIELYPSDEDGEGVPFAEFEPVKFSDDFIRFAFGDYRGMISREIYDSFVAKFKQLQVETGEPLMDDILRKWLDV